MLRTVATARRVLIGDGRALRIKDLHIRLREAQSHLLSLEKNVEQEHSMRGVGSLSQLVKRLMTQFQSQLDNLNRPDPSVTPTNAEYEAAAELGDELTKISEAIRQVIQRQTLI